MSVKLMSIVLDLPFKPKHKLVMVVLSNYANDAGENVYPSLTTMQRQTSLTRPAVVSGIKDLRCDLILVLESKGSVTRKSSRYHINVTLLHDLTSKPDLLVNGVYQSLVNGVSKTSKRRLPDPLLTKDIQPLEGISNPDFLKAIALLRAELPEALGAASPVLLEVDEDPNRMLIKLAEVPAGFMDSLKSALAQVTRKRYTIEFETPGLNHIKPHPIKPDKPKPQRGPDESVTRPLPGTKDFTPELAWAAALGELQLEMTRATFETWVKPTVILSANGSWKIGTPDEYAQEWLEQRLRSTVTRVLTGVVGQPVRVEFVVIK